MRPPAGGKRRYGYSRDKRPDCVQVVNALVITPEGLPVAYEVMAGNTSDKTTLKGFLAKIEEQYGRVRRTWVMDRGITTEEVLAEMRQAESPIAYLVGTPRGQLNKLEKEFLKQPWSQVRDSLEVKLLPREGEVYILARSQGYKAPLPTALDPSTLEQIYATGAANKLGPGFNLVGQSLAQKDRQQSAQTYLDALNAVNQQVQQSGNLSLAQERLLDFIKYGTDLTKTDPLFASTPIGQFALTLGQGPEATRSADVMAALASIGEANNAANRFEKIGTGYGRAAEQGLRLPTGSPTTMDELTKRVLVPGAPTSVMTANINANAMTKPQYVAKRDPGTGQTTIEARFPMPTEDVARLQGTVRDPYLQATDRVEEVVKARAMSSFDTAVGSKFINALKAANVGLNPNATFRMGSVTDKASGKTVAVPKMILPNGQQYALYGDTIIPVNPQTPNR